MPCSLWILTTYLPWPWPPLTKVRKKAKTGLFRKRERPNAKRHDYTPQDCRPLLLAQAGYLRPIRLAEVDHGLPLLGHSPRSVSVFTGANPCTSSSSEKITRERKNDALLVVAPVGRQVVDWRRGRRHPETPPGANRSLLFFMSTVQHPVFCCSESSDLHKNYTDPEGQLEGGGVMMVVLVDVRGGWYEVGKLLTLYIYLCVSHMAWVLKGQKNEVRGSERPPNGNTWSTPMTFCTKSVRQ